MEQLPVAIFLLLSRKSFSHAPLQSLPYTAVRSALSFQSPFQSPDKVEAWKRWIAKQLEQRIIPYTTHFHAWIQQLSNPG